MKAKRAIVWFRQDLRVHDNEALTDALKNSEEVVPVYVFDDRVFKAKSKYGFAKTGAYRTKFILQSILDLKTNLAKINLDLIVRTGNTEDEIFELAKIVKPHWVFCNRERTKEEVTVQDALEQKLWSIGQEIRFSRGKMLYHTADLPFPVTHTPNNFTSFRKEVEKFVSIREPFDIPEANENKLTIALEPGEIPSLIDFGFKDDETKNIRFEGGETKGLDRLEYYFWDSNNIAVYKKTRNGMLGTDYSSGISAYLSQGCISAKRVFQELSKYEKQVEKNDSTYWLFFELLWRDFFRFIAKKEGNIIFLKGGIKKQVRTDLSDNRRFFELWTQGKTGYPLIDANMRELKSTGHMSNRGRQNVASFLINDLKVNWQMGADYFESLLIDYDPCSNWGNWNYLAGVGTDPRADRHFNIAFQTKKYDPKAEYISNWIPELEKLPIPLRLEPYNLSQEQSKEFDFILGREYPKPMVKIY